MAGEAAFPARLAILTAVTAELNPVRRALGLRPCRLHGLAAASGGGVLAAAGGMGMRRAARAAHLLIEAHSPDLLLVAGVAGALHPDLNVGDLLVVESLISGEELLCCDTPPALAGARAGILLHSDDVLAGPAARAAAHRHPLAPLAVEMETAGAAGAARAAGIPWAAIRAISDTASEELPLDFNALRDEEGDLPALRVALHLLRAPHHLPGVLRLSRRVDHAAARLAAALRAWRDSGSASR